jgi:hypothetical protein
VDFVENENNKAMKSRFIGDERAKKVNYENGKSIKNNRAKVGILCSVFGVNVL